LLDIARSPGWFMVVAATSFDLDAIFSTRQAGANWLRGRCDRLSHCNFEMPTDF
jgi:hypothetical protein